MKMTDKQQSTKNKTRKIKTAQKSHFNKFNDEGVSYLDTLDETILGSMIEKANQAYYSGKEPLLTDNVYDALVEYVLEKYPNNKKAKEGHTNLVLEVSTKQKVKLPYEMWSMDKIKPDTNALNKWKLKYNGPYVCSCKLDGVSGLFVGPDKLYTRGNGKVGQDISHLIPYLKLPKDKDIAIRGEFIITKQTFETKYSSKFSNSRNFVAGVINQKKVNLDKIKDIDFVAYEVIHPEMKPSEQMKMLSSMNIKMTNYVLNKNISNEILSNLLVSWRNDYIYEIDGVICADDKIYQRKSGNPLHAFAFKMVLGDQVAEAKVVDVLWNASKDGYLKPRIQIEPLVLGGAKIEYATGFNARFIVDNNIGVGTLVKLIRSGDVIPHISSVVKSSSSPLMPKVDYIWNETQVDIMLKNKEDDNMVNEKIITSFFKNIGVDGLGAGNIARIMKSGYNTIPKILKMTKENFMEVEGFKGKMADKVYNGIQEKIQTTDLPTLMEATNIFGRGFGRKRFQLILNDYPDILINNLSNEEKIIMVENICGMAHKTSCKFVEKIEEFKEWLNETGLSDKLNMSNQELKDKDKQDTTHPLYNKTIVMTGFRDKDLISKIEGLGGKISNSVSKNTFLVLTKNINENTGKINQAKKLSITILTPEQFIEQYSI